MQYTDGYNENVLSFANNINTHSGGTHLTGFRNSITRVFNDYGRSHGLLKEKDDAQAELDALYEKWEQLSEEAGE